MTKHKLNQHKLMAPQNRIFYITIILISAIMACTWLKQAKISMSPQEFLIRHPEFELRLDGIKIMPDDPLLFQKGTLSLCNTEKSICGEVEIDWQNMAKAIIPYFNMLVEKRVVPIEGRARLVGEPQYTIVFVIKE